MELKEIIKDHKKEIKIYLRFNIVNDKSIKEERTDDKYIKEERIDKNKNDKN